jgi:hypothetical protein
VLVVMKTWALQTMQAVQVVVKIYAVQVVKT